MDIFIVMGSSGKHIKYFETREKAKDYINKLKKIGGWGYSIGLINVEEMI